MKAIQLATGDLPGLGIPQTEEAHRAYRELIVTAPGLGESISGVILYDETIRQQKKDGTPFVESHHRCGNHSRHQSRHRRQGHGRSSRTRKSPKASTDCATASRNTFRWEPVLPSGER